MSARSSTMPIPAVLMKTPSPWPESTTLVSPVTNFTPSGNAIAHTHAYLSMGACGSVSTGAAVPGDVSGMCHLEPPIQVVGGASPFGRHHRRAKRIARRALLAEGCALVRLDHALQHLAR